MDIKTMLNYLSDLELNNEREWYHANKVQLNQAQDIFMDLVFELSMKIGKIENEAMFQNPKELIYRLARDIRFSKDKTPYNPSFRAHISPYGKKLVPLGYYIWIQPGNRSFFATGLHTSGKKELTNPVRDYIAEHGKEFVDIIEAESFKKYFQLKGDKLKRNPAGYSEDHPQIEYLKHKSWYVEYVLPDEMLADSEKLIETVIECVNAIKPFKEYLNRALKSN